MANPYFDESRHHMIDDICVDTFSKEFANANILEVEVGSTGLKGGDSGHGARHYLAFKDLGSTDMRVDVFSSNGDICEDKHPKKVALMFGGDAELDTLIKGLEFAVETLKRIQKPHEYYNMDYYNNDF